MIEELKIISDPGAPQADSSKDAAHKRAAAFLFDPANARILDGLTESKLAGPDLLAFCETLVAPPKQPDLSSGSTPAPASPARSRKASRPLRP